LKTEREKDYLTHRGKHIRITSNLSIQNKARKSWSDVIQALRENTWKQEHYIQQSYPSFMMKKIGTFQNKDNLKLLMSTMNWHYGRHPRKYFTQKRKKTITNMRGQESIKLKRGIDEPMRARKASSMISSVS
jgi:hypothetical protein